MLIKSFRHWLSKVTELSSAQREQALERLGQEQPPEDIIGLVMKAPSVCPRCHHRPCGRWGHAHGLPRYRCGACQKTFNPLTGTPFAGLRHRARWAACAQALIDGASVREAARRCAVHKNTAFRWRHRFLVFPANAQPTVLQGIVEADETYFLESRKGTRHLSRPPRRRGGVAGKRGLSAEQIPVLIARDRSSATLDAVLEKATTDALHTVLEAVLSSDALLCSDGGSLYRALAKRIPITHKPVNIRAGIRVVEKAFHIQNVNAYTSRLKGWMLRFHGVATKYLPHYLGWRRTLERFGAALTPSLFLAQALGMTNT